MGWCSGWSEGGILQPSHRRTLDRKERTMRIFVGNIAFTASEFDLEELFGRHGRVSRAQIATDRETGRSRGFAFVEMPDSTEAQAAIEALHGASFAGRPLTVNEARPREGDTRPRRPRW